MSEQYEKAVDRAMGGPEPWGVALLFIIPIAIAVLFVAPPADTDIEAEFEKCVDSGGVVDAPREGEVLYCVYDNGTGYKLGVEDEPRPLETQSSA